jgi:hypothetical protein
MLGAFLSDLASYYKIAFCEQSSLLLCFINNKLLNEFIIKLFNCSKREKEICKLFNFYKHCFNANILTINTFKVCGDLFYHTIKLAFWKQSSLLICIINNMHFKQMNRGARKLTWENLKVVWAEFSTYS